MNDRPRISRTRIMLRMIRARADTAQARAVLDSLERGIRDVIDTIERAAGSGDEDYAQFITDDEVNFIEELLGAASVVCQRQAVSVASIAQRALTLAGVRNPDGGSKWTLRSLYALGGARPERSGRSDMILLNDVANYYKHQDEWSGAWESMGGTSQHTVAGITMLGMSRGSTGNLRTAAEALGNGEYTNLDAFLTIVKDWSRTVIEFCDQRVK